MILDTSNDKNNKLSICMLKKFLCKEINLECANGVCMLCFFLNLGRPTNTVEDRHETICGYF